MSCIPTRYIGLLTPNPPSRMLHAALLTYSPMFTACPSMSAVETCGEIEARSHDGSIVDGLSARQFARQNGGAVTLWVCMVPLFIHSRRPNHACAHGLCALAEQIH
eukprot:615262-Pleurochrysis_carterae.AAC.2